MYRHSSPSECRLPQCFSTDGGLWCSSCTPPKYTTNPSALAMAKKHKVKAVHEQIFENGQWWYRVEWAGHNKGYSWPHTWQIEEDFSDCSVFQTWKSQHPVTLEQKNGDNTQVVSPSASSCFEEPMRKCDPPSPHSSCSSSFSSSIERKCSPANRRCSSSIERKCSPSSIERKCSHLTCPVPDCAKQRATIARMRSHLSKEQRTNI